MNQTIILGPPGTGKTTRLLREVETLLAAGVHPSSIAFLAFTRRAAKEARERAKERFEFTDEDMPWFRTIHSMCFRCCSATGRRLITGPIYKDFCTSIGVDFKDPDFKRTAERDQSDFELPDFQILAGDNLLSLDAFARLTNISLEVAFARWRSSHERDRTHIGLNDLKNFSRLYRQHRGLSNHIDYTDALELFVEEGHPPEVDFLIVDEAQDLSHLQWKVVRRVQEVVKHTWIAGDDDQAIYRWAGADVNLFQTLEGKVEILDQSYRLPQRVHDLAIGLLSKIRNRREKAFAPTDRPGEVVQQSSEDDLDAIKGSWLFLVRHTYQLRAMEDLCRRKGWFYTCGRHSSTDTPWTRAIVAWENFKNSKPAIVEDLRNAFMWSLLPKTGPYPPSLTNRHPEDLVLAGEVPEVTRSRMPVWFESMPKTNETEYIRMARDNGERLLKPPRIRISTIHGAKGAEADNTYLSQDISFTTIQAMDRNPDDELRVFYVGATRCRDRLIIRPQETNLIFPLQ